MRKTAFLLIVFAFMAALSADNIADQLEFLEPEDQFDLLYKLSVKSYFSSCEKSVQYGLSALEKANLLADEDKKLLAYYNLATAYSLCRDYEKAGTYLNLFNESLKNNEELFDQIIKSNLNYDDETRFNLIRNQLEEILRNKAFQDLQISHKDLQLQNQRNFQKYYLIIIALFIVFGLTSYQQWQALRKTNIQLQKSIQELNSANYKLEQIARTDPLTKISNRRDLIEKIEQEKRRFSRNGKAFVVIMADIDDFKAINDKQGHDAGDFVLQSLSHLIRSSMRKQDIFGRWGGEEFVLLLPETYLEGGKLLAEKIRQLISETPFVFGEHKLFITVTFGVYEYDKPQSLETCIRKADEAMYEGKRQGKNCVVAIKPNLSERV